ncbi:MAG: hypothetical protein IPK04_06580 [Bdellovibrionales bacterium]|nr:hypothetical protein [Bdellovibrionales bacterium]
MYIDRIFMPLAFICLMWLYNNKLFSERLFYILVILCVIITDRSGIYIGSALLFYTLFKHLKSLNQRKAILLLGVTSAVFSYSIIKLYLDNPDYADVGSRFSLGSFLTSWNTYPDFREKSLIFLVINIPLFSLISLWCWPAALVGYGSMIPNLFGSMGGGEKTSFLMHYHSFYFPILAWAMACGVISFYQRNKKTKLLVPALLVLSIIQINRDSTSPELYEAKRENLKNAALFAPLKYFLLNETHKEFVVEARKQIAANVPEGSIISVAEPLFPALYENRQIHLYPMGIDDADIVVTRVEKIDGSFIYTGAPTFVSDKVDLYNRGLTERLSKKQL